MSRFYSESADQNKEPLLAVLRTHFTTCKSILEIASGTGQHVAHFAKHMTQTSFQPSERDDSMFASIASYTEGLSNVRPPVVIDSAKPVTLVEAFDAILNFNMIHISDFATCHGLFAIARKCLNPQGRVLLYGPFYEEDVETAPSNVAFDRSLRARNSAWGVRRKEEVIRVAQSHGLSLVQRVEMPVNNLSLIFEK